MISLLLVPLALAPSPQSPPTEGPAETEDVGVVVHQQSDPIVFPDPSKFSRGFFVEAATGTVVPVGPTGSVLSPGFAVTGRIGYEIRRWIAVQGHASASISRFDDGVLTQELFQQYVYTGEVRFGIPIRRFLIALQGGAGIYQSESNLLQLPGIAEDNRLWGFAYDGSLALDFHSLNRHFSAGLLGTFVGMPALGHAGSVFIELYVRYTL